MSSVNPSRRGPGPQVDVVTGPKGDPGDPRLLLEGIAPGEAVSVDADGNPAPLSVVSGASIADAEAGTVPVSNGDGTWSPGDSSGLANFDGGTPSGTGGTGTNFDGGTP